MRMYKYTCVIVSVLLTFLLLASCNKITVPEGSKHNVNNEITETNESTAFVITWDEITEDGVNEELLIKNINEEELKSIAHKLKTVTDMIIAKGDADKLYWQTANWYADAKESNEFKEVVSMGQSAVKPLYLIIYKSESQGLYEYICAMALDEVLGEGFFNDNSKMDWATSKELIKIINEKVLKDRQDNQ